MYVFNGSQGEMCQEKEDTIVHKNSHVLLLAIDQGIDTE